MSRCEGLTSAFCQRAQADFMQCGGTGVSSAADQNATSASAIKCGLARLTETPRPPVGYLGLYYAGMTADGGHGASPMC